MLTAKQLVSRCTARHVYGQLLGVLSRIDLPTAFRPRPTSAAQQTNLPVEWSIPGRTLVNGKKAWQVALPNVSLSAPYFLHPQRFCGCDARISMLRSGESTPALPDQEVTIPNESGREMLDPGAAATKVLPVWSRSLYSTPSAVRLASYTVHLQMCIYRWSTIQIDEISTHCHV